MSLSNLDKIFYTNLQFLSSIPSSCSSPNPQTLSQNDLYQICSYIQPFMLNKNKNSFIKKIHQYRNPQNLDTCLHIAAKAGNKKLVEYLLNQNIIDANSINKYKQTPLMSVLRFGQNKKSDKIAYILASINIYSSEVTDLTLRNANQERAYEIPQAKMDPARAKLIEYLKNLAIGK